MQSFSIWFSAPSFWVGGGLESRCVCRVCGADVAVRVARQHPHRTHDLLEPSGHLGPVMGLIYLLLISVRG